MLGLIQGIINATVSAAMNPDTLSQNGAAAAAATGTDPLLAAAAAATGLSSFNTILNNTPILLFLLGTIGTLAWRVYYLVTDNLSDMFWRYFVVYLDVNDQHEAFYWLMEWLSENSYSKTATHVQLLQKSYQYGNEESDDEDDPDVEIGKRKVRFVPAVGLHFMFFKGRFLWMYYSKGQMGQNLDQMRSSINVNFIGRKQSILRELIVEARKQYLERRKQKTTLYVPNYWADDWYFVANRPKRPISTVVLKDGIMEMLLEDIREFLASKRYYAIRGIPWRRGFLLHGPPGTGKTSLTYAVAGEIGFTICILNLSSKNLTDDSLNSLLTRAPQKSIILIEDIDSAWKNSQSSKKDNGQNEEGDDKNSDDKAKSGDSNVIQSTNDNRVTFSGLLNALDGCAAYEGRIFFLSTNFREKLQESLVRPGRIDVEVEIGYADELQVRRLIRNFYPLAHVQKEIEKRHDAMRSSQLPDADDLVPIVEDTECEEYVQREQVIDEWLAATGHLTGQYTLAELQGHLLNHKANLKRAVKLVDAFVTKVEARIKKQQEKEEKAKASSSSSTAAPAATAAAASTPASSDSSTLASSEYTPSAIATEPGTASETPAAESKEKASTEQSSDDSNTKKPSETEVSIE